MTYINKSKMSSMLCLTSTTNTNAIWAKIIKNNLK